MNRKIFIAVLAVLAIGLTILSYTRLKAVVSMEEVANQKVNKQELVYNHAYTMFTAGRHEEALRAFTAIVDEHEKSLYTENSLKGLAAIYENKGDMDKAVFYYEKLLRMYPDTKDASVIQAKIKEYDLKKLVTPTEDEELIEYTVQPGDSLYTIARKFNTTVPMIQKLNKLPTDIIRVGDKLKISNATYSIFVDKSDNILILKKNGRPFKTYTVATGENNSTPVGTFIIVDKMIKPPWTKPGAGVIMPDSPDYELGDRWMPISEEGYGIHGTNDPSSIGKQVTNGCVRMYNEDVVELYDIVPKGTEVEIVD